jgi:hypothetical protein
MTHNEFMVSQSVAQFETELQAIENACSALRQRINFAKQRIAEHREVPKFTLNGIIYWGATVNNWAKQVENNLTIYNAYRA